MAKFKFKKLGYLETFLTITILGGLTTALYLYTSGYRLRRDSDFIDLTKTGMVNAKSLPDGASVYIDDKLRAATDDSVAGLEPGNHTLKIIKNGFVEWTKDVEVFEQLVTDVTAVLVSQSPRLEPLTSTGANKPSISPSLSKLAYFSFDTEEPGIWIVPLSGGIGAFRRNPTIAIEDTVSVTYSSGKEIIWSPDENELLVEGYGNVFYLIDLVSNAAETTSRASSIKIEWQEELTEIREAFLETIEDVSDQVKTLALSDRAVWAPDEKKFLYTTQVGDTLEYRVYNFEDPLPIGENVETVVFRKSVNETQPKINWYADSFHLILVEGNVSYDKKGTISLIRIDGTNKTEIYNNTLHSDIVFSTPGGDKAIISTSFKSSGQTDLYTVSIR
ncbi:PEGA domain-containing protein [Patescibacteria group bacterium]